MFKPNTLLIVGAGASEEVGMPLGTELVEQIAGFVNFGRNELTGRLPEDDNFVRELMNVAGLEKLRHYERAAVQMVAGMRSAESVDRFIDRNRDDEYIRTLGKAAIVKAISFKERTSKLIGDKGNPIRGRSAIDDTWYWTFVRILLEGSPAPEKLFDDIAIVCFNYDRCIEHYLTCELMRSYHIDREAAAKLVSRLTIWHPYGTIAQLDTQDLNGVAYGDNESVSGRCFHLAARIRTFTEKHEDRAMIDAIRARIRAAETVVFLGFGYYKQNLELIEPDGATNVRLVLGTGFGLSDSARHVVVRERLTAWDKGDPPKIEVPHMKCAELLNYYRLQLSA
jgi:hypothetical protein